MTIRSAMGRLLIALVVINAAAGVTALVASSNKQIGSFEGHIFLTTLAVSMAAFSVLPCLLAYERDLSKTLAGSGIAASLLTLALLVALIWTDDPSDDLWRSTFSVVAVSLGLALVNLLSLAVLPRSNQWIRLVAYALTALTAAELIAIIWNDDPSDTRFRFLGASLILVAASSVLVPILQRMSRGEAEPRQPLLRFCPSCGAALAADEERAVCANCSARFSVRFE